MASGLGILHGIRQLVTCMTSGLGQSVTCMAAAMHAMLCRHAHLSQHDGIALWDEHIDDAVLLKPWVLRADGRCGATSWEDTCRPPQRQL
eukprot:359649-Chlamydomonas_euryale.AAC.4